VVVVVPFTYPSFCVNADPSTGIDPKGGEGARLKRGKGVRRRRRRSREEEEERGGGGGGGGGGERREWVINIYQHEQERGSGRWPPP